MRFKININKQPKIWFNKPKQPKQDLVPQWRKLRTDCANCQDTSAITYTASKRTVDHLIRSQWNIHDR